MKKLLSILLLFMSFGAIAQTYDQLPGGSKPYGNQLYLSPTGLIIGGTQATKFRVIGTKKYVDSLLALKADISLLSNYVQLNPIGQQNGSINVSGNIFGKDIVASQKIVGSGLISDNIDFTANAYNFNFKDNNGDLLLHLGNASDADPNIIYKNLKLNFVPSTASQDFDILTRDKNTGEVKKISSTIIPTPNDYIASLNGSGTNTTLQSPTIVNGSINNAPIGLSFPNQGKFTTLNAGASTTLERLANKGQVNGYASLDASGKVPLTQVNDVLLGAVNYQGNYNASNDTPALPAATGNKGKYYVITNSGTQQNLDFNSGDWIISNGTIWEKVDNNNKVASVNGRIGAVSGLAEQSSLESGATIGANTTGSADKWAGKPADFGSYGTGTIAWLVGQNPTGTITAWDSNSIKNFIGLNNGSILVNSISGNAASTNLWGGLGADFSNGYSTDSQPAWILGAEASSGKARPFSGNQIANLLGIPSGGETLQSVTDRGSTTTRPIVRAGSGVALNLTNTADADLQFEISNVGADNKFASLSTSTEDTPLILQQFGSNVGIGTLTPQSKLEVTGDISLSNNLIVRGVNDRGLTFINGGNTNAINSNNNGLDFYTGNNSYNKALRIDVNGHAAFTGIVTGARFIAKGTAELASLYHDAAYIAFYNTAGDTRTGYVQSNASGNLTLQSEAGNKTLQLNSSGGNAVIGSLVDNLANKLQVDGSIMATNLVGSGNRGLVAAPNGTINLGSDDTKANLDGGNNFTGNQFVLGNQDIVGNQRISGINTVDGDLTLYSNLSLNRGATNFFGAEVNTSGLTSVGAITLTRKNSETENIIKISPSTSTSQNINLTLPTENGKLALIEDFGSGTYTPTVTGRINTANVTPATFHYTKVGNQVTVYGSCSFTPTATGSDAAFSVTLPPSYPSTFTTVADLNGHGGLRLQGPATVEGVVGSNVADVAIRPTVAGIQGCYFSFTYTIK